MKKIMIGILGICLLVGVPFIIMDLLAGSSGVFHTSPGYKRIELDLGEKARDDEVVYTKELKHAAEISFMIQSDADAESSVSIESDEKFLGSDTNKESCPVGNMTGTSYLSPKMLLQPGKYTIKVTNIQTGGKLMIGYKERKLETAEYERLLKIDKGELNNPPEGYELVYSADLSGLAYNQEVIYDLTLNHSQKVGISVYTNASSGKVSVDFAGESNSFIGLVTPKVHYICDRLENTFGKGNYKIRLSSEDADGQIYIFIKK